MTTQHGHIDVTSRCDESLNLFQPKVNLFGDDKLLYVVHMQDMNQDKHEEHARCSFFLFF